jgi:hypothetical protein
MNAKAFADIAGVLLVVTGLAFMAVLFIWPSHFATARKSLDTVSVALQTNIVGFGIIIAVAVLLVVAAGARS